MTLQTMANSEQAQLWNGPAGRAWVDSQELLDRLFEPFESLLADAVAARRPQRVLDVGCGTGATTLAIARRLGAEGECVGIDISQPMIELARMRAQREGTPVDFICADAQHHAFEAGRFDVLASRFGVMFFDRPADAFANLRHALRDEGEMHCLVWRSAQENPFMTTAEHATAPLWPALPPRRPDGPGQFAFADPQRVRAILRESGWSSVAIEPVHLECTMPESDLLPYLTRLGSVGLVLHQVDGCLRKRILDIVRAAFEPYVHGDEVRFTAACWRIVARADAAVKEVRHG